LLFLVLISLTLFSEVNMLPFPLVQETSVPSFYNDIGETNGTFSVLDIPQTYEANNLYMYYATVSEKPLVGGAISRIAPSVTQFLSAFPVITQMDNVRNGGEPTDWKDIVLQDVNMSNLISFNFFNVGYVVMHKEFLSEANFESMRVYLAGLLGQPVYADDRIVAFATNTTHLSGTFGFLSNGWWPVELQYGFPKRWMSGDATIEVISPSSQQCNLRFFVCTDVTEKNLRVSLNDEEIGNFQVPAGYFYSLSIDGLFFKKGINTLSFSSDQSWIPAEENPNSPDTRRLSFAFQNISISQ
jgi:hypothetical protein